jgi:hypothetical protein
MLIALLVLSLAQLTALVFVFAELVYLSEQISSGGLAEQSIQRIERQTIREMFRAAGLGDPGEPDDRS